MSNIRIVTTDTDRTAYGWESRECVAYHLDSYEDALDAELCSVYVYAWETELPERRQKLVHVVNDCRAQYVFATGIEYMTELMELVPLDSDEIHAYAVLTQMGIANNISSPDELRMMLDEVVERL